MIADGAGRAIAFRLAPGPAHELPHAVPLLDTLPERATLGRGRPRLQQPLLSRACLGPGRPTGYSDQKREAPVACPGWVYSNRHRVENLWARLKEWRAVATRYEKTARSFMGVLCLAAALDWLRR